MVALWIIYLLIILILLADALLTIGVAVAVAVLAGSILLGIPFALLDREIDRRIKDMLTGSGGLKALYSALHLLLNLFLFAKGLPALLAAVAYIVVSGVVLLALNALLAWLIYSYLM